MASKRDEVIFGEGLETQILSRWMRCKAGPSKSNGLRCIKSKQFQDWDFLVLDGQGLPVSYVEIKMRRQPLKKYKDALAPLRKHHFALDIWRRHGIPFVMVVEYPDALIELDLKQIPAHTRLLGRHDRPQGQKQDHAFWTADQFVVIDL